MFINVFLMQNPSAYSFWRYNFQKTEEGTMHICGKGSWNKAWVSLGYHIVQYLCKDNAIPLIEWYWDVCIFVEWSSWFHQKLCFNTCNDIFQDWALQNLFSLLIIHLMKHWVVPGIWLCCIQLTHSLETLILSHASAFAFFVFNFWIPPFRAMSV